MKRVIPLSVSLLFLVSCSRYQYATIASANVATKEELGFVAENDTLRIVYNFNGCNAPVNITVYNKLDIPVYVDWQRSALVVNDQAISYVPQTIPIEGAFSGASYSMRSYGYPKGVYTGTSGSLSATAILPEHANFIPPKSYIKNNPLGVTNRFIETIPDSVYRKEKFLTNEGNYIKVQRAVFTEASSPLKFKSYITAQIGDKPGTFVTYEHSFYVTELMNAGFGPESVMLPTEYKANKYYVREATGAATGFGIVAGVAILTAAAAIEQRSK